MHIDVTGCVIAPPVRNSPRCVSFFGCRKLVYRSWVIPLCILLPEPVSPRLLNSISSKFCHQNTQFNTYAITSKQQEGSTCKDSYPKCFITTNFDKFHREGAINTVAQKGHDLSLDTLRLRLRLRLRLTLRLFRYVATFYLRCNLRGDLRCDISYFRFSMLVVLLMLLFETTSVRSPLWLYSS